MATTTNRFNIKDVFFFISEMVMVSVCLFIAISTLELSSGSHIAFFYCDIYLVLGMSLFWVLIMVGFFLFAKFNSVSFSISNTCFLDYFLAMFTLVILFNSGFCLWGIDIFSFVISIANFAVCLIAIFAFNVFIKLSQWFGFLADTAFFGFNFIKHSFSLIQKSVFRVIQARFLGSSLHCSRLIGI